MPKPEPTPFQINVSEDLLQFITHRVATARIPPGLDLPQDQEWSYGIPPATVHTLRDYWATKYSWRDTEARINARFKMFTLPISESGETLTIHFVHHRSEREGAVPLLFQHGWPGNFLEVERIIDALTDPPGGQQAYHVVAPSLPGFAFSEGPRGEGFRLKHMAAVDHKLMLALGYGKYMAQGGDWGSLIVRIMALDFPESCVAVHVNAVVAALPCWWRYPLHFLYFWMWAPFQGSETALGRMLWWKKEETGYSEIQGTKPQTLCYALADSPVGMLAWIRDKMQPLIDEGTFRWEEEEVITWAMLYIIPGTSSHAQIYKNMKGEKVELLQRDMLNKLMPKEVDFGASIFPKDMLNIPKWWASVTVSSNIVFWKEHDRGGHFAATEKPDELVQDIRDFTEVLNPSRRAALKDSGKLKR